MTSSDDHRPAVACYLGPSAHGSLVGFAREGGQLPVRAGWGPREIRREAVALHDGPLVFARDEPELLRALATRTLRQSLVLYLGSPSDLDDDLRACAITVASVSGALGPARRRHHTDRRCVE